MSTVNTITESGMNFSFDPDKTFLVEKYVQSNNIEYVKTVEFIQQKKSGLILLIEAKTSAPNPKGKTPEKFKDFIDEITQKAIDSFSLLIASIINRRNNDEIGTVLKNENYDKTNFCLVLIIKNHEKTWLSNIQNTLNESLRHFHTTWKWGSTPVIVLNEELAEKQGLIISPQNIQGKDIVLWDFI